MFGVRNVSVHFGEVPALDDVSFDVAPGTVSTVVGGDGAGKTTLLRVLAGRVVPERGTVSAPIGRDLGMLPASAGSWANLTVRQNLEFVASVFGLSRSQAAARSSELIELAGLQTAHDRLGSALSGGMRRKLGVIMALVGHPRLVLLDEPSTGVDPVSRVELWRLISRAAAEGAAVLTTTTYLDEAERATRFLALEAGRTLLSGDPAEAVRSAPGAFWVATHRGPGQAWRVGRSWHCWAATAPPGAEVIAADLHDVVVAAALRAKQDAA